ncbi:hypothetical protein MKZ26_18390 [Sporosarcina sp. FSL K6-6792]|uniref:hypothetical protein n=1 Tax=Sporosarcina sp. FSL K6-6792 TaxID=2921559 RepID=UPI0030FC02A3
MKTIKNTKKRLSTILLPLFAFMLVLSTVLPSMTFAADGGTIGVTLETKVGTSKVITEGKINSSVDDIQIVLKLTGNKWVAGIDSNTELKSILLQGMTTNQKPGMLSLLLNSVIAITGGGTDTLTITVPKQSTYLIEDNQVVTMDISPVLIENWYGSVEQVNFTIYAKPKISVGGSILNSTPTDIQKGGKAIELNLINAKWDETVVRTISGWNSILDALETPGGTVSNIAKELKKENPNNVVYLVNGDRTLRIVLPAFPSGLDAEVVTLKSLKLVDVVSSLNNGITFDEVENEKIGNTLTEVIGQMTFNIKPSTASSLEIITGLSPIPIPIPIQKQIDEAEIKSQPLSTTLYPTIVLKLNGNAKWDSTLTDQKKNALIDALVAESQPEQWKMIKEALKSTNVTRISDKEVGIVLPEVKDYYLTANQKISLTVPHQLLEDNVDLNSVSFEIKATPKALISGTVTANVSQADIIKGGKTIIVTMVNEKWEDDIATNKVKREKLLSGFNWGTTNTTATAIIDAGANVVRTSSEVVTITLPPVAGFKVPGTSEVIKFNPNTGGLPVSTPYLTEFDAFTVTAVKTQTPTISGTILSNTNEFDIVEGGKVITITLKNDIWAKDAATQKVSPGNTVNLLMSKFTLNDAAGILSLNKDESNTAILPSTPTTVVRTSDTVMTITLGADAGFSLKDDAIAELDIPAELLSVSSNPIPVKSAFKISAVKAELPSGKDLALDKEDIKKGGKTITITLKNATLNDKLDIEGTTKVTLINDLFDSNSSEWLKIENALKTDPKSSIKITKDKITIKLPPVPDYNSNTVDTIKLNVPDWVINHAGSKTIAVDGEITTGAVATANLTNNSFSNDQIKAGNGTLSITLTGTTWDPTLTSNNSKKTALLKGFTVTDQTKEWALLSKEISSKAKFELTSSNVLKITLPAVPGYSIIRNQVVDVVIPKSILVDYKTDIAATSKLTITLPTNTASDKSLGELNAVELADAITTKKRVIVPNKKVETIYVNSIELPSSDKVKPSITTIEVTTASDVSKIELTITGQPVETVVKAGNKYTVVYKNLPKNSELKVSVFDSSSKPLQADIYKKIGNGSKTYNEIPKKDYTGSYLVYDILTDKSLLKEILKYYSIDELKVTQ